MTPSEIMDLLISKAEQLRKAGVSKLSLGDVLIELTPYQPEPVELVVDEEPDPMRRDMFDDPSLYGNGRVPGYRRKDND